MKQIGLILLILLALTGVNAKAATYYATAAGGSDTNAGTRDHPFATVQKGIDVAAPSGDTVVLMQEGNDIFQENVIWMNKSLHLISEGFYPPLIDGGQRGACLTLINVPSTARIDGITFQNEDTKDPDPYASHTGLVNTNSSPTITNCDFSDNSAGYEGGGMSNTDSSPIVTNCTFTNNDGGYSGGGMFNDHSSPIVTGCAFSGNQAYGGGPAVGGGGMGNVNNSAPVVTNCAFSGNGANQGGAVYNNNSSPTVTHCAFTNNSASFNGGGVCNDNSAPVVTNCAFSGNQAHGNMGGGMYNRASSPLVTGCSFTGNTASFGGGMANLYNSAPVLINCPFSGNSAGTSGGGMDNSESSTATVTNCIFSGNRAAEGGGMDNDNGGAAYMVNCTFTGNAATDSGGGLYNGFGSGFPAITNCIFYGDTGNQEIYGVSRSVTTATYSDIQGGYAGTGNINADPLFVNPTSGNYRLQLTSPCIDKGSATAPNLPATDLVGEVRILGSAPDMGAYETWLPAYGLYVDKAIGSDTSGTGSPRFPYATVTKAIAAANAGNSLYIKAGNYGTDKPRITKSLRLFNWLNTGLARIGQP